MLDVEIETIGMARNRVALGEKLGDVEGVVDVPRRDFEDDILASGDYDTRWILGVTDQPHALVLVGEGPPPPEALDAHHDRVLLGWRVDILVHHERVCEQSHDDQLWDQEPGDLQGDVAVHLLGQPGPSLDSSGMTFAVANNAPSDQSYDDAEHDHSDCEKRVIEPIDALPAQLGRFGRAPSCQRCCKTQAQTSADASHPWRDYMSSPMGLHPHLHTNSQFGPRVAKARPSSGRGGGRCAPPP